MSPRTTDSEQSGCFPATRWSLVLTLRQGGTAAEAALSEICRLYWRPVYTYIRASGFGREDSEDLAQEYMARVAQRNMLDETAPEKGRLRTYFAVTLRNFLINARERAAAQRRGGHLRRIEGDVAESESLLLASREAGPDALFDRHWALTLLGHVLERLRVEYVQAGKADVFAALRPALGGGDRTPHHAQAAEALKMSAGAVRVALHRLRRRYRDLLLEETAHTLGNEVQPEEELRALLGIL